jgi:3-dehydrotetronate 4-kinase
MKTVQYCGVPRQDADPGVEAGIVALKSRSIPVQEAIEQSLTALKWLLAQGCQQILFKYCSTFDSTPDGNIGQVAAALADALGAKSVIVCPSSPTLGRRVFQGHLFVGDKLLSQSGMENHPLNPMTESDIRKWLSLQTTLPVEHIPHSVVVRGADAIARSLEGETTRLVVVDTSENSDLLAIGAAVAGQVLISGGSGIALGLPANFGIEKPDPKVTSSWPKLKGPCVALSGSCSTMTLAQVRKHGENHPVLSLDADAVVTGNYTVSDAMEWLTANLGSFPLISTTSEPKKVRDAQEKHGQNMVSAAIDRFFADLAITVVASGVNRLILAGGETSGAVIDALELSALTIGPEIAPGVPAIQTTYHGRPLALALKSGNFGSENFFSEAENMLGSM